MTKPGAEANDHGVHFLEGTTPWALGYLWTGNREFLDATIAWHDLLERDGHAALRRAGRRRVLRADRRVSGNRDLRRGRLPVESDRPAWPSAAKGAWRTGRNGRSSTPVRPRSHAISRPTSISRVPTASSITPRRVPMGPAPSGCSYKATHFPLCCTAALNRIVPNYVMHMWMATYDNGLAATYYGPCKVSALAADRVPVEIVCRTDYPFNEVIEMSVKPAREATFPLSFRIPGWCKNPELERERVRR